MIVKAPKHPHLIFDIIDFYLQEPNYFTFSELIKELKLGKHEAAYVFNAMVSMKVETSNPNHILVVYNDEDENGKKLEHPYQFLYGLLPNAIIQFTDYEEIKEARQNANDARIQSNKAHKLSLTALYITGGLAFISVVLQFYQLFAQ